MDISIVITTYNRKTGVDRLLDAFADQDGNDFQVVVAIDGSTDGTAAMLAAKQVPFDLKWVDTHCSEYGLAVARNRGILAADGKAVAILDDDSFPEPGYVAAHRASAMSGVITGGLRRPSDAQTAPYMAWKADELAKLPPLTPMSIPELRRTHPNAYLIENNICLLREDWIAMGLFSERLKLYGFIGQEFFARAEYLGLKYQLNPDATVSHRGEMEGDNGLMRSKKNRQIMVSQLVRPSLMKPTHYRAQIAWAKAMAAGEPEPPMPGFKLQAGLSIPYRLARSALLRTRKALRGGA